MLLAAAPLIGYFGGAWLDRKTGYEPLFTVVGVLLGLVAGVRETIIVLRKASREPGSSSRDDSDT